MTRVALLRPSLDSLLLATRFYLQYHPFGADARRLGPGKMPDCDCEFIWALASVLTLHATGAAMMRRTRG